MPTFLMNPECIFSLSSDQIVPSLLPEFPTFPQMATKRARDTKQYGVERLGKRLTLVLASGSDIDAVVAVHR